MNLLYPGALIRRERIRLNWSQEGLCRGICAVSWLSKIEQGKAQAGPELLHMLFERLNFPWYDDERTLAPVQSLTEHCYEALFSCDDTALALLGDEFSHMRHLISHSPYALDGALLGSFLSRSDEAADQDAEPFFDNRQLALQRLLQGRYEEALGLYPCPYFSLMAGMKLYENGGSDAAALERLRHAYEMAAQEGQVRIMLLARLYMGNCYSNRIDIENMNAQYLIAKRLARALGDEEILRSIRYNEAATALTAGSYEEAYAFFSEIEQPSVMELHKLAICCEQSGRREEALAALERAQGMETQYPDPQLSRQMCDLVRFRLKHKDYLQCPLYGEQLVRLYNRCRSEMPIGYAAFHLPWVLEWYTACRQYRAAYELVRDFPVKTPLKQV